MTNGAAINTTATTNKIGAGKVSLDGSNDYVNLSNRVTSFQGLTTGTIAAWVRPTASQTGVIFQVADQGDSDSRLALIFDIDGSLDFYIRDGLTKKAATFDKPAAALIEDLERRGLLEDTLVLCTGEFGRTPFREGRTAGGNILGRDHYPDCYSVWMAGAGVKGGHVHGSSDDLGFKVATDPVHVHDLQATILHLLGFDHTKLTWRFQGRDFRLTDVHGHVVKDILA